MKIIKSLFIFGSLALILNSCSSLGGAGKFLRNEKVTNTDEFLIKKKQPLVQPPDFQSIPEPGSDKKKVENNNSSIKKMLKNSKIESNNPQTKSSTTEQSILNQINK